MNALPRSYGVFVKGWISGRYLFAEGEFKKQLGQTAWMVWCKLCFCRDAQGYTHVTRQTLRRGDLGKQGWQRLTDKQVKTSLARLRDAGLVENVRYIPSKGYGKVLMKRRIYGALMLDPSRGDCVAVPLRIKSCIESLKMRGGKREGAGRRKRNNLQAAMPSIKAGQGCQNLIKRVHIREVNQKVPHSLSDLSSLSGSSLSEEREPRHGGAGFSSFFLESNEATSDASPTSSIENNSTTGSRIASKDSSRFRYDDRLFHESVPPFPGPSVVSPAQIPSAPRLDPEKSEQENVEWLRQIAFGVMTDRLMRGYREDVRAWEKAAEAGNAQQHDHPKQPYAYPFGKTPKKPTKTIEEREAAAVKKAERETAKKLKEYEKALKVYEKNAAQNPDKKFDKPRKPRDVKPKKIKLTPYEVLASAVQLLIKHDLQPALWIAWSLDNYHESAGSYMAKTSWIFSEERITKYRAIFRGCIKSYSGGTLVPGVCYRELVARYSAMRRGILNSNKPIDEIVDEHFPGRLYRKLVADAKTEAEDTLRDFRFRIARGEYLWD